MISDSIPNASVAMASSNPKDFAKKKRANRSAKLKQCKLDARREQWLSQVKNKGGCKVEVNGGGVRGGGPPVHLENERGREIGKLEIKQRSEEEIYGDGSSLLSDSESLVSNSPSSHTSSVLGSNDSGVNFTTSSRSSSSSSSGRSTSSSSNGFCSGNMSEEDEGDVGDDDCLDDWEAVADALAATDYKQQEYSPDTGYGSPPSEKHETAKSGSQVDAAHQLFTGIDISNGNPERTGTATQRAPVNCCAWRPDDACRPQTLPSLSKQYSFPLNSERHIGRGSVWSRNNLGPIPKSCPICFEDLDGTDSSFLPCSCGFRLCLFCHKRILEEDGRCPGCRKQYEREPVEGEATFDGGSLTLRLARSCSMIARS